MTAPIVHVHSYSYFIKLRLIERMKLIPPFNTATKFVRSNARPTQPEHIPFVAVYFMEENLSPLGDLNHAEPKFTAHLKLGISYIIQNNNPDVAEDILDAAHWSFMKLLHDPSWSRFVIEGEAKPYQIEGISAGSHDRIYGNLSNETPIAEMRMEMTYVHGFDFEPIPLDLFEIFHMTTIPRDADPTQVKPIITEWVLPQD
jgi:hypothetical protein